MQGKDLEEMRRKMQEDKGKQSYDKISNFLPFVMIVSTCI